MKLAAAGFSHAIALGARRRFRDTRVAGLVSRRRRASLLLDGLGAVDPDLGRHGSHRETIRSIADELGCSTEVLRNRVKQAEIDSVRKDGVASDERVWVRALEHESFELRRTNEILHEASACFAPAKLDRRPK